MAVSKKDRLRAKRRKLRVRNKLRIVSSLPRLTVFRSLKHFHAQIIDDTTSKTLASCSTVELKNTSGDKKNHARNVGIELAKRALENNIHAVVLDRGPFLFHGRIAAFADGVREGGLKI